VAAGQARPAGDRNRIPPSTVLAGLVARL
jgi:hypothetical protein